MSSASYKFIMATNDGMKTSAKVHPNTKTDGREGRKIEDKGGGEGSSMIANDSGDKVKKESGGLLGTVYNKLKDLEGTFSKNDLTYSIYQSAREGLEPELIKLLEKSPSAVNYVDNSGNSPMHLCARYNRTEVFMALLAQNADVNISGAYGVKPLHVAAKFNSLEVTQALLKNRADILCRDCKQKTPLHYAARKGHPDIAKLLLSDGGCDANVVDEDKQTPLHEAMLHRKTLILPLLENGADVFAKDINDGTPLMYAAAGNSVSAMKLLLDKAKALNGLAGLERITHDTDCEYNSPLHHAVQNNNVKAAKLLLDVGADVNLQNNSKATPLHMAAMTENKDLCVALLEHGATLDAVDCEYMTPVHRAAIFNKLDVIKLFHSKNANLNSKTADQMTPLLCAAWKGHMEVVKFLLDNGAKITDVDKNLKTVLHWTVEHGHFNVLTVLLKEKYGGKQLLEVTDQSDHTITHYAAKTGNATILKSLINQGCRLDVKDEDGQTPLHLAAKHSYPEILEILTEASTCGVLNDGDGDGRTPLMVACHEGHLQSVRVLLSLGADHSIRDDDYCPALLLAASRGHSRIIALLLDNFAEIDHTDKLKNTALHRAAAEGQVEAVNLLLNRKATVTMLNSYMRTALDLAIEREQTDVCIAMLKHKSWKNSMNVRDSEGFTPMKKLIENAPDAALVVMDHCVENSDHRKDDVNYTLRFDYQYIDPGPDDPSSQHTRFFAAITMAEHYCEKLLSHPLLQSFLIMKWNKFGRVTFYFNLLLYFLYLCLLSSYSILSPKIQSSLIDNVRQCPIYLTEEELQNKTLVDYYIANGQNVEPKLTDPLLRALQFTLDGFVIIFILREIFVLFISGWRYFLNIYSYNIWLMLLTTIIFLMPPDYVPCVIQWRSAWLSAVFSWILFIMYLRRFDRFGIYVVMFSEVVWSLMKVIVVLILFVMAFSQAFIIVMARTPGFRQTHKDIFPMTVFTMMLGEINYQDLFVEADNQPFTVDAYILLAFFMLFMPIALMNLLVGIAVGDIEKIQNQAFLKRLALQINEQYDVETRFPRIIQRWWYQQFYDIKPNKGKDSCVAKTRKYFGLGDSTEFIKDTNEGSSEKGSVKELQNELQKYKHKLSRIESLQISQFALLKQLCQHMEVDVKGGFDQISLTEIDDSV